MTETTRTDFADFLRSRRGRLLPEDVGLPAGTRRRVAGLRREEVAQISGVGLTWYTWLEQGRPVAVSEQVLRAIARALRMSEDEHDHLFALAGLAAPKREATRCIETAHVELLERLMPYPAVAQNARFDVLAFNRAYRSLFDDFAAVEPERRNCARLLFTDEHWQNAHVDLSLAQRRVTSRLRAAYGRHHDEPIWQQFISDLRAESGAFRALWDSGDVDAPAGAIKRVRSLRHGIVNLEMHSLWIDGNDGARVVWFTPADDVSASRVRQIADDLPDEPRVAYGA